MSTLQFDQVSLQFRGAPRASVNRVTGHIQSGEVVVLLGPSGCGKTTLLKMVNRLYEPTGGQIYLDGCNIRQMPVTQLRLRIGYVIQQAGLFPHMTVAQNIAVVPQLLGWSPPKIRWRVEELLNLVQLTPKEYAHRYPNQLSGGQQQRVGLARALAGDPALLLMDEPFGALDAITRTALQNEILRLQQNLRKTILFVSHDVEEALRLADRVLVMREGQVVQFDTPWQLLNRPADAFVARLVGTDDRVRSLGLLRVSLVMADLPTGDRPPGKPTISPQENLRQALSLMLQTGTDRLVVGEGDRPVGILTLDQIRQSALHPSPSYA